MVFDFVFNEKSNDELDRFVKEVLDKINEKSASARKKMYKRGNGEHEPKGCFSISYGYCPMDFVSPTKRRVKVEGIPNTYETNFRTKHPELLGIFQQFLDLYCEDDVTADQVHINKNWLSPKHKDKLNGGDSYIIGLGGYENGELVVEKEDGDHIIDIHNKLYRFNGNKYTHYTKPFEGTRYSLVFYNNKKHKEKVSHKEDNI